MNRVSEVMNGIGRKKMLDLKIRIFLRSSSEVKNGLRKYCNNLAMKSMFLGKLLILQECVMILHNKHK
jgi:hypothetical protein